MSIGQTMMVVEHHDGHDTTACYHEHDAVEVGACKKSIMAKNINNREIEAKTKGEDV